VTIIKGYRFRELLIVGYVMLAKTVVLLKGNIIYLFIYEGWNFNSGNYLFTTDTK